MKQRNAFWYCMGFLLVQAGIALACPWIGCSRWYLRHDGVPNMMIEGYFRRIPANQPCDIVIIGDSTAMADFDPAVLTAQTGLSACNIAEIGAIGKFIGERVIYKEFLKSHAPPRYLIGGFTPEWGYNLEHEPLEVIGPLQIQFAVDYDRGPWLRNFMRTHPADTLEWVFWIERGLLTHYFNVLTRQKTAERQTDFRALRAARNGQWLSPSPDQAGCTLVPPPAVPMPTDKVNQAQVAAFQKELGSAQTTVLVYATPVADCDPDLARFKAETAALPVLPLEVHPATDFNDTNIHLSRIPAERFSAEVGDHIAALEVMRRRAGRLDTSQ